jgi:hypothetical protein
LADQVTHTVESDQISVKAEQPREIVSIAVSTGDGLVDHQIFGNCDGELYGPELGSLGALERILLERQPSLCHLDRCLRRTVNEQEHLGLLRELHEVRNPPHDLLVCKRLHELPKIELRRPRSSRRCRACRAELPG